MISNNAFTYVKFLIFTLLAILIGIYAMLTNSSGIIYVAGVITGFAVSEFLNYKSKKKNG